MHMHLSHLYRETHHWVASVEWWEKIGFTFTEQWGEAPHRAGSLRNDGVVVVLAEVAADTAASATTFLAASDIEAFGSQAGAEVSNTHWGTRMVSVTDPDGRTYNIEPGESE